MSTNNEQIVQEVSREEIDFINAKSREYKEQGASDLDAAAMAAEDWAKAQKASDEAGEEMWDKITKQVGLADLLDDQIRRSLGVFKTTWQKHNPEQTVDFSLELYTEKGPSGLANRLIAGAGLRLSVSRNGVWSVWRDKRIAFQHIAEMRDGHKWKLKLYEAMLQDILAWGVNHMLVLKAVKDGDIKLPPKDGESTGN